jgi:hypothetical protein
MTKVYIAGPMSGYKDWNFPAFFEAERQLEALGYEVTNPAHNDGATVQDALQSAGPVDAPNNLWSDYMKRDLPHVMNVDMVCLLPGWQDSKGASLEVHVARAIGLPLMVLKDEKLIPRVTVLGLSGWARSGKDTIANCMVENHGYLKMSFADPLKDALEALNPKVDISGYYMPLATGLKLVGGWEGIKGHSTEVRPLLQRMGTEVGREMFGENFWVDAAIDRIPDGSKVIFADVRFPNEAKAIKDLGGQVWRVERVGYEAANGHISEHALDDYEFDERIRNTGTVEDLCIVADGLLNLYI